MLWETMTTPDCRVKKANHAWVTQLPVQSYRSTSTSWIFDNPSVHSVGSQVRSSLSHWGLSYCSQCGSPFMFVRSDPALGNVHVSNNPVKQNKTVSVIVMGAKHEVILHRKWWTSTSSTEEEQQEVDWATWSLMEKSVTPTVASSFIQVTHFVYHS